MASVRLRNRGPETSDALAGVVAGGAEPFGDLEQADLGPLLDRLAGARLVLIGEASHGTSEFYRMRARITRTLIDQGGIAFVALEADWPDAARLDAWVRDVEGTGPGDERGIFHRFPSWMWRNEEVLQFIDWLREHNAGRPPEERVAIRGLDLYSLGESIEQVLAFLEAEDPELALTARDRYGCLNAYVTDPAMYGYAAWTQRHRACEGQVVGVLSDLLTQRLELLDRGVAGERVLDAEANARVVAGAERYYRTMYRGGAMSWNLRDEHMFETLVRLLDGAGPKGRGVVWAHNSHLGDASATEMAERGEHNVGQLTRQRFGRDAYLIGFGTHTGTVAAAREWDAEVEIVEVRPSLAGSHERLFHDTGVSAGLVPLRDAAPDVHRSLVAERLERAIGVIYRPDTERWSHYFGARLADQFDEYVWLDETHAVTPLGPASAPQAVGHPFATLDA